MTEPVRLTYPGATVDTLLETVNGSNLSATHKITRSATLVVAASDSSAKSKAQADYVCDGTNDEAEIQAAITALPAIGGSILILEGNYSKGAAAGITIPSNTNIILSSGAIITLANGINADACIFTNSDAVNGNKNISITGYGILRGNEANQTTGDMFAISLTRCVDCSIDCFAEDFTYADRQLINCTNVKFINRFFALPDEYGKDRITLIDCQTLDGWTWTATQCVISLDETISINGKYSIKSTVTAGSDRHYPIYYWTNTLDLSKYQFELYFYIPDADYNNITDIDLRIKDPTYTNYSVCHALPHVAHLGNGWHCASLSKGAFVNVSGFVDGEWKNVKRIDVIIKAPAESSIWLGGLFAIKMPQEGVNVVTFDDGNLVQYTIAKKYLDKYNMPAVAYIISGRVGTQNYITWEQARLMQSCGWDISAH